MNLRASPLVSLPDLMNRAANRSDLAMNRLMGNAALFRQPASIHEPSIWEMTLPNSSYMAPRSAFWFISRGKGR